MLIRALYSMTLPPFEFRNACGRCDHREGDRRGTTGVEFGCELARQLIGERRLNDRLQQCRPLRAHERIDNTDQRIAQACLN